MQAYIPETGHRDPQTMWLIITVITVTSPLLITLLERYVREPEENGAVPRKDSSDGLHAGEENLGSRNPMQPPNLRHKDIQLSSPSTGVVSSPKSVFEYDV